MKLNVFIMISARKEIFLNPKQFLMRTIDVVRWCSSCSLYTSGLKKNKCTAAVIKIQIARATDFGVAIDANVAVGAFAYCRVAIVVAGAR